MANIDYGRTVDLKELAVGIKNARSKAEREHLERIVYRILKESTKVSSLRSELIAAFRVKDMSKVRRLQAHIQAVKLDETRGTSWGQNKEK